MTVSRRHSSGFTLIELMMAIAILMVFMGGITALFSGSMRAVKQGYQNMDAFEVARGALQIVERDLTAAFTSRDYGDYYTFYGTDVGMTFVGTITDGSGASIGLSRVTYVLYEHDPRVPDGLDNDGDGIVDDTYGVDYSGDGNINLLDLGADGRAEYSVEDGLFSTDVENSLGTEVEALVRTRSLLRFVEPNERDLNTFTEFYTWPDPLMPGPVEGAYTPNYQVWLELRYPFHSFAPSSPAYDISGLLLSTDSEEVELGQIILQAKKRDLWIRMMAGEPSYIPPNNIPPDPPDPSNPIPLPNIWALMGENPADYVVAENIFWCFEEPGTGAIIKDLVKQRDFACNWFMYGRTAKRFNRDLSPSLLNVHLDSAVLQTELKPTYNALDNIAAFGALTAGTLPVFWSSEAVVDAAGDPLKPRLPEFVQLDFELMLSSPYPGAPDFRREFRTTIDLPAGFVRDDPPNNLSP